MKRSISIMVSAAIVSGTWATVSGAQNPPQVPPAAQPPASEKGLYLLEVVEPAG